jgi:hypothetical protein
LSKEANIWAYNDVFQLVAVIAASTALYLLFLILRRDWRARRTPNGVPA